MLCYPVKINTHYILVHMRLRAQKDKSYRTSAWKLDFR